MESLKPAFLDTARHYAALGRHDGQYASLLTFAALDPGDTFTVAELAGATRALPPDGLRDSAQALVRALDGAGEQRGDYWTNRIKPYLHAVWPKTRDNISAAIAENLGRLCVAAQEAFPEALALLRAWLQPLDHPDYLVHRLHEANLCSRFPEPTLEFLSLVIGVQTQWPTTALGSCLDAIRTAVPALARDPRFEALNDYLRQYGRGVSVYPRHLAHATRSAGGIVPSMRQQLADLRVERGGQAREHVEQPRMRIVAVGLGGGEQAHDGGRAATG
jgi:hypothetical protein